MASSTTVRSGATICASSIGATAEVTADRGEVGFDNPVQGAGWYLLRRAEGGKAWFTVHITTDGVTWSDNFTCAIANADEVRMRRAQERPTAAEAKR